MTTHNKSKQTTMKTQLVFPGIVAASLTVIGCSQESRDNAIKRASRAAVALNGGASDGTPDIVREQRERERERQNSEWTPENQAKHPIEYCQAQLEELRRYEQELEVSSHKVAVAKSETSRKLAYDETQSKSVEASLAAIKEAYRKAEASGGWPFSLGEVSYTREFARNMILESSRRAKTLKADSETLKRNIAKLDAKFRQIGDEQRKLSSIRARVQSTLNDLRTKAVVDGSESIGTALDAINDSIRAFDSAATDPGLDALLEIGNQAAMDEEFSAVMAE